jgi:ring-1,2-phenylacetyl-CoA epoxidase subunit PaaD
MAAAPTIDALWAALDAVPDPEVPAISVVELGIVRNIAVDASGTEVTVTPTYSGCPAMQVIERDILSALTRTGARNPRLRTVYAPAWTTDWMTDAAREKLRAYGIAPPGVREATGDVLVQLSRRASAAPVPCPFCGSSATELRSEFGPTACKAIRFCRSCSQPFEQFKAI